MHALGSWLAILTMIAVDIVNSRSHTPRTTLKGSHLVVGRPSRSPSHGGIVWAVWGPQA